MQVKVKTRGCWFLSKYEYVLYKSYLDSIDLQIMRLKQELEYRGFLKQYTHEELFESFEQGGKSLYFWCDPTADSLHLGNFCVFMQAVNYMKRGNKLYLIVGGATGMIGDPGGKDAERSFLSKEQLAQNEKAIGLQVENMLSHLCELSGHDFEYEVINNKSFYEGIGYLDFLREVGKYITVNYMMTKETVKKRIEDPDKSISYTEFSYMLLQAYDYYRLYQEHDVTLQIAWSDQRGNVTTGWELIRKKADATVYGVTGPLVLDSTGRKFGKSEGNAIWLSPEKNSPYVVYQYFLNTSDEDVQRYLKLFTLLDEEQIIHIMDKHEQNMSLRYGQEQLAIYVVTTIFGAKEAAEAEIVTNVLFGSDDRMSVIEKMDTDAKILLQKETGNISVDEGEYKVIELATQAWLTGSNGEAKKMIKAGSLYLNEQKIEDASLMVTVSTEGILLRKGKKKISYILPNE